MGALGFQFVSAEAARAWVHAYYNAFTRDLELLCEHDTNPNIAVVSQFMCAPTDAEALARAEGSSFFQFALGYYATHAPGVPGEIRLWDEHLEFRDTPAGQTQRVGGLIGSPWGRVCGPGTGVRRAEASARRTPRLSPPSERASTGSERPADPSAAGSRTGPHRSGSPCS